MSAARVALVRAAAASDWHSQNQVHRQLEKAWGRAFPGGCKTVRSGGPGWRAALASDSALVVLDHQLELAALAGDLLAAGGRGRRLLVHLFADFLTRESQQAALRRLRQAFDVGVIVASRWMRERVAALTGELPIAVVPSPVDEVFFEAELGRAARGRPRWAYVGRLHPDKGVDQLLAHVLRAKTAAPRLELLGWWSDARYETWSPTSEHFLQRQRRLGSLVSALGLEPRLARSERALSQALREVDFCVFPSVFRGEEFGYALAQALAAGKRCCVSDWQGHRDFADCPGVETFPVSAEGGIPRVRFDAAPWPSSPAPLSLQRRIRRWARDNHSVTAAAAKLRLAAGS